MSRRTWYFYIDITGQWKKISGGRPFVIKGIQSAEDALKAYEVGCEGIVVTNHAGRQVDGAVGSLEVLPEIAEAVGDSTYYPVLPLCVSTMLSAAIISEMTIIFDSGVRTGADVFKAIALGAHVVAIGRLFVWGMAHEGEYGCRHVLKSLLAVRPSQFRAVFSSDCALFHETGPRYPDDGRRVPKHHERCVQE